MTYYINHKKRNCAQQLSFLLQEYIQIQDKEWNQLVFLCIGSDRITGDSLGPFIGHQLLSFHLPGIYVYGTLKNPVHALNLEETLSHIKKNHPQGLLIAIDASLGQKKHLGYITMGNGSIQPGAGVHKTLPAAGDIHITGIVCAFGMFQQMALQNTRLSFIVSMADVITRAVQSACLGLSQKRLLAWEECFQLPEGRRRRETKLPPFAAFTKDRL